MGKKRGHRGTCNVRREMLTLMTSMLELHRQYGPVKRQNANVIITWNKKPLCIDAASTHTKKKPKSLSSVFLSHGAPLYNNICNSHPDSDTQMKSGTASWVRVPLPRQAPRGHAAAERRRSGAEIPLKEQMLASS